MTELLIATMVVGIIMLGVASSDFAVRKMAQGQGLRTVLDLNTRVLIEHTAKNVSMATGDKNNIGFSSSAGGTDLNVTAGAVPANNYFCIREDMDNAGNPNPLPGTPTDYSDDHWRCYSDVGNVLYTCLKNAPADCTAADTSLGSIYNFTAVFSVATGTLSISILNRTDPTKAVDISSNPQVRRDQMVYPTGHSI